jgi:hypothetical protein
MEVDMTDGTATDERLLTEPGVSVADFRDPTDSAAFGDRRDGKFYRYTPEIKLASLWFIHEARREISTTDSMLSAV